MKHLLALIFFAFYGRSKTDRLPVGVTKYSAMLVLSKAGYLDPAKIKINGSIKFIDSYQHLVSILGKPDRIVKAHHPANGSYYNRPFEYCCFKGLVFERYGEKVVFNSMDFKKAPNAYLSSSILKFDSSIKIESVKSKLMYNEATRGTDMDLYTVIFIPASKTNNKNQWVLYFDAKTDKLFKITYWSHAGK